MGLFATTREYKTQLFFHDEPKFRFIKRELLYTCLVMKAKGLFYRGWKHFYGSDIYFGGHKNMSAAMVTLGFNRDIILDPFNKIPEGVSVNEKPKSKDSPARKKWLSEIAENQRHIYRSERKSTIKEDIINCCLAGVLVIMILAWLVKFARGMYQ